jgi:hypothetical protein
MWMLLLMGFYALDGPGTYGAGVREETPTIAIQKLMDNPESYLDKVVRVEGEVKAVCPMKGCWLDLEDGRKKVRIKVRDGEIVFDRDLVGKRISAEGTVYKIELTREQAVRYYAHLAEEKGESFDPDSIDSGTVLYQIGGLGAELLEKKVP